jgi:hypothetical protein
MPLNIKISKDVCVAVTNSRLNVPLPERLGAYRPQLATLLSKLRLLYSEQIYEGICLAQLEYSSIACYRCQAHSGSESRIEGVTAAATEARWLRESIDYFTIRLKPSQCSATLPLGVHREAESVAPFNSSGAYFTVHRRCSPIMRSPVSGSIFLS